MSLLVIQPSNKCDGGCLPCRWSFGPRGDGRGLPTEALDKLKVLLNHFKFNECVLLCPNPLFHPKLDIIIDIIQEMCTRTTIFLPISVTRSLLNRKPLEKVDTISLLIPSYDYAKDNIQLVKTLVSQGLENIEAYILFDSNHDFAEILSTIDICKRYGLKITVGPMFYTLPYINKFTEYLEKREDVEIGLRYGKKYHYNAIKVFLKDYPVTVLTSNRIEDCRTLYVDPHGYFSKCPLYGNKVYFQDLTSESLRKMVFSSCPINNTMRLSPRVRISLVAKNGVEISSDILELLELVFWLKSFRGACRSLGVPPSTFWEKIKTLERELGTPLLVTIRGGRKKGRTTLSEFAQKLLNEYTNARKNTLTAFYR